MAIAINGTGTITGITSGGLPDGIITEADLATGVNAITHYDSWRVQTDWTGDADPIASNWERAIDANGEDGYGTIGTAMTESSGIFTFPVTGIWKIEFSAMAQSPDGDPTQWAQIRIQKGTGSFETLSQSQQATPLDSGGVTYANPYQSIALDIKDLTEWKVRFRATTQDSSTIWKGSSDINRVYVNFLRIGAT